MYNTKTGQKTEIHFLQSKAVLNIGIKTMSVYGTPGNNSQPRLNNHGGRKQPQVNYASTN